MISCSPQIQRDLQKGRSLAEQGLFSDSMSYFEKVLIRSDGGPEGLLAAKEAAKIALYDLKASDKAIKFLKFLVMNSKDNQERINCQKQISEIYFEQLNDYKSSIVEINRLLTMLSDPTEKAKYKMDIARAYYYQNNFFQAESEVDEFLRGDIPAQQKFDMTVLKGNILIAQKKMTEAADLLLKLLDKYPEIARRENIELTLSVIYEEQKDYKNAILMLEKLKGHHPMPEYVELRIKKLVDRQKNLPGAKGFRK